MARFRIRETEEISICGNGIDPALFTWTFRRLFPSRPLPQFHIEHYPYRDIKNTLRIRDGVFRIRVSDMLEDAPGSVMEALYEILLCKTLRIKADSRSAMIYNRYLASEEFKGRLADITGTGGAPVAKATGMRRQSPELTRRFDLLNREYFKGRIESPDLFWIDRKSARILGQYVSHRDEILINSKLDHPLVPQSVIDFILYHEMLHKVIAPRISRTGRKMVHHREFKKEERKFRNFKFANDFIRENF